MANLSITVLHTIKPFSALMGYIYSVLITWFSGVGGGSISYPVVRASGSSRTVAMRRPDCCSSGYCRRLFCTLHEKILESNRLCRLPALLFILPQSIYDSDVIDMSPNFVLSTAAFAWTKCCSHQWCYCCAARTDPEEHIPDRLCPMTSPCPTANVLEIEMTYLRTLRSVLCLQQQTFCLVSAISGWSTVAYLEDTIFF